jgi:hypothetical protein
VAGTVAGLAAALVVNLGGGDMAVAQKLLDLAEVGAAVRQGGGGGGPQGVGRVKAAAPGVAVSPPTRRLLAP